MIYNANWNYPTSIALGAGRVSEVADECKTLGIRKPLIVTDAGIMALPFVTLLNWF